MGSWAWSPRTWMRPQAFRRSPMARGWASDHRWRSGPWAASRSPGTGLPVVLPGPGVPPLTDGTGLGVGPPLPVPGRGPPVVATGTGLPVVLPDPGLPVPMPGRDGGNRLGAGLLPVDGGDDVTGTGRGNRRRR